MFFLWTCLVLSLTVAIIVWTRVLHFRLLCVHDHEWIFVLKGQPCMCRICSHTSITLERNVRMFVVFGCCWSLVLPWKGVFYTFSLALLSMKLNTSRTVYNNERSVNGSRTDNRMNRMWTGYPHQVFPLPSFPLNVLPVSPHDVHFQSLTITDEQWGNQTLDTGLFRKGGRHIGQTQIGNCSLDFTEFLVLFTSPSFMNITSCLSISTDHYARYWILWIHVK